LPDARRQARTRSKKANLCGLLKTITKVKAASSMTEHSLEKATTLDMKRVIGKVLNREFNTLTVKAKTDLTKITTTGHSR
jgi:hypothetical protein